MIFQFVICAAILRKLVKQTLKRHWVNCYWFLALGKGRATESVRPKDPRAPRFFFRSLLPSAAPATLGLGDSMRPQTPHARAKFLVHDVMMFTDNFCVTFFPHEREPSPLETVKRFFSCSKIKSVLLEDLDRKEKFQYSVSSLWKKKRF